MMTVSTISVILPVYNAERYVAESINSILNQTFGDFELLIINDGSTDKSKEIILSFHDKRIRYIENKNNQGLIKTLNKGLFFAKGEFIARVDADDLCKENRFHKQINFFRQDDNVDILGTNQYIIDEENKYLNHKKTNEENRIQLLLGPPVAHSSVMIKRDRLTGLNLYYDKNALYAEDYKLWIDASLSGISIKNIDDYLCGYRFHQKQISSQYSDEQKLISLKLRIGYANRVFCNKIAGREKEYVFLLLGGKVEGRSELYKKVMRIYEDLLKDNKQNNYFDTILFEKFMEQRLNVFYENLL